MNSSIGAEVIFDSNDVDTSENCSSSVVSIFSPVDIKAIVVVIESSSSGVLSAS